ncbi:MAG: hypothetical protein IJN48_05935 [Clostridia bacterium]|nr:hypothetical protein [Clostridia bacterium]
MKRITKLLMAVMAVILMLALSACTPKVTVDELKAALPQLVEDSKVLNEIYFGEGFKVDGSISDVAANGGYYYCDCTEFELYSISDIKDATEKVFTSDYSKILYEAAFDGVTTDSAVEAPRFSEGELGLMQKASDEKYVLKDREFDYDSLKVQKRDGDRVTVMVNTYVGGARDDTITLIVVRSGIEGNYTYRLDSPTY